MPVYNKRAEKSGNHFRCAFMRTAAIIFVLMGFVLVCHYYSETNKSARTSFQPQKPGHDRTTLEPMRDEGIEILIYNKPFWLPSDQKMTDVLNDNCPHLRCSITTDKRNMSTRSAVVFSIQDGLNEWDRQLLQNRNPNQPWLFFYAESPQTIPMFASWFNNKQWLNTMNWSMSYQTDSDIFYPYAILEPKPVDIKNYSMIFHQKDRFAAWFVSHCTTVSKREKFVKELQKFGIPVDIYGGCSNQKLDKNEAFENVFLEKHYKFYLSFENSLCRDYITEKFFAHYNYDLILVVRGGSGYSTIVPNNTFINVADFGSIKDLANYLLRLNSSEAMYTEYMKRKNEFSYRFTSKDLLSRSFCNACEKVRKMNTFHKQYHDIRTVVFENNCQSPTDV